MRRSVSLMILFGKPAILCCYFDDRRAYEPFARRICNKDLFQGWVDTRDVLRTNTTQMSEMRAFPSNVARANKAVEAAFPGGSIRNLLDVGRKSW